jgi:hypothetical protein
MDLSRLSIQPRLRNGWQAIDLGFAMARQWYWPAFLVWLIPSLTLYVILSLFLTEHLWLALLLVWWMKPLWDRLPLAMGSRALFSEALDVRGTLRNSWRTFRTDLFPSLTWRRFSPSRSFDLPVTVLEGLRGQERGRRLAVLHQTYGSAATWLTMILVHVEGFLALGLWAMAALFVPEELGVDWLGLSASDDWLAMHFSNLITYTCMALVAPFYTLAGFALYVCRRIQLEGWDIEIRFRHLAEQNQRADKNQRGRKVAACLLPSAIGLLTIGLASGNWAQAGAAQPDFVQEYYDRLETHPTASDAKQRVVEVRGGEDFHRIEMEKGWRLKDVGESEGVPEWVLVMADFFDRLGEITAPVKALFSGFAGGFELVIWILVIAVIGFLIYRFRHGLLSFVTAPARRHRTAQPDMLFGLDIRKESLPEDVCGQVQQWWAQGRQREALSLLYRATLSRLVHQFAFEFSAGYTEQECVDVVSRGEHQKISDYLVRLTRLWQQLAYAHRLPESAQVASLCVQWQALFGETPHAH